jgi:Domain found in Dishevelled, Egl-10, and Pleckstrin (DEP)
MNSSNAPTALLCMPNGHARYAVSSCLAALHIDLLEIMPSRVELAKLAQILLANPQAVAIIDLANIRHASANIVALKELLPEASVRQRIALTRTHRGTWPTDRSWARELGFADLYAELDSSALLSESSAWVDWLAQSTGVAPIESSALKLHFDTAQIKPDNASQRAIIRQTTGLSAEAFCTALNSHVKIEDRTHNVTHYPLCFLGSDAVDWLKNQYAITRQHATRLGIALQELGMLHHAAHEQEFTDGPYFFRTELSESTQLMSPGATLSLLTSKTGVLIQDRNYHGTNYPDCFVGSHAVDWLHAKLKLSRLDAEIMLNRLYGFDLIEHVTREHIVLDDAYFYRFIA